MEGGQTLDHTAGPALEVHQEPVSRPAPGRSWGMRDVAKLAEVSHQTVHRVFNSPDKVKPETRERVMRAVAALNYRPSAAARALTTRRSGVIGVIDSGAEFFGTTFLLSLIERAIRRRGYATHVTVAETDTPESVEAGFSHLLDREVEGIVIMGTTTELVEGARQISPSVPVAMVSGSRSITSTIPHVGVDSVAAAITATEHLVEQGCRRVAHVSGPRRWAEAEDRIEGWRTALARHGLADGGLFVGDWLPECGYELGRQLAAEGDVDGVFVANDHMALGLMCALTEQGVRIPEDVAVVGFDDVLGASVFSPPLSTMRQPFDRLAEGTVSQLLAMIDGKPAGSTSLSADLIVRRSSRRAPAR